MNKLTQQDGRAIHIAPAAIAQGMGIQLTPLLFSAKGGQP